MTKLATLGLIAILSTVIASQAWAQEANPEPAYCAQYYPNADCNSIGPKTPESPRAVRSERGKAASAAKKGKRQSSAATATAK
jgi:hypothetical protein